MNSPNRSSDVEVGSVPIPILTRGRGRNSSRGRWYRIVVSAVEFLATLGLGVFTSILYHVVVRNEIADWRKYLALGLLVATLSTAFSYSYGGYSLGPSHNRASLLRALAIWCVTFGIVTCAVFLFGVADVISRGALLTYFLVGAATIVSVRFVAAQIALGAIAAGRLPRCRVVIVSDVERERAQSIASSFEQHGYEIVTWLTSTDTGSMAASDAAVVELSDDLVKICRSERVDEIVLALPWSAIGPIERLATLLRVLPLPVRLVPDTSILNLLRQPMTDIGWAMAIDLQREPMRISERFVKRALDLSVACGALLFFSPVMLVAAVAIKLESRGPVFFRQSRIGFSGRRFRIWKFRTMTTLDDGGDVRQAERGDARVTRFGAWLRKTSLDEIPQFFNVLAGEMSVVGPRPHALAHDDQYDRAVAGYAFRHHMKPGITGWAQVQGLRGQTPTVGHMAARVEQDIWYINNWNLLLDVKIVFLTFGALMRGVNAY